MDNHRFWPTLVERLGDAYVVAAFRATLSTGEDGQADREMWEQCSQVLADAQEAVMACTGIMLLQLEQVAP